MEAHRASPAYEVHCGSCRVTFPVGTRRCIHCGGPTSASPQPGSPKEPFASPLELPVEEPGGEPAAELGRRRAVSPMTLVWILLIAGGYLVRACSGQGP